MMVTGGENEATRERKEYETYVKEKTPVRKPGPAMAKCIRDRRDHLYDWADDLKCVRKRRECQRIFLQAGVH